jgi:hypothetical protein
MRYALYRVSINLTESEIMKLTIVNPNRIKRTKPDKVARMIIRRSARQSKIASILILN